MAKHPGKTCVAGGPGGISCTNKSYTPNVSMHIFPKNEKQAAAKGDTSADTSAVLEPYEDCDSSFSRPNRRKWGTKQSHAGKTCSSVEEITGYTRRVPECDSSGEEEDEAEESIEEVEGLTGEEDMDCFKEPGFARWRRNGRTISMLMMRKLTINLLATSG
ncbi:unnamed protein product, partial [Porites evermanni]